MDLFNHGAYRTPQLVDEFAEVGENVTIAATCTIIGGENIRIGNNVQIDSYCTIIATGPVKIGSYVHIGAYCLLGGRGGITLEDFSGLSSGVKIYTASDDYSGRTMTNPTVPSEFKRVKVAPVRLGRHCIVGSGAVILPGADIAEGVAVGALSLVNRPTKPWGTYSGVPARRIAERKRDLLESDFLH